MHSHAPAPPPAPPRSRVSMLRRSAAERLALVAVPLVLLWVLVAATLWWWP